ncbi:MAG: phosphatidylglycerophosphatase A [Acidobacteria bacterium]|nr:phosphatidylglycerophosphatase A [Acidobacteriota bacterium]
MSSDVSHASVGLGGVHKTRWAWITATFFGAGLLKPGPGTFGSIAATIVWFPLARLVAHRFGEPHIITLSLAMAAAATLIGIPAATRVAIESGRKDPQIVVIDEVAGQWLALALMPPTLAYALIGLVLFRVFDILKPPPVRMLERLPQGTGIIVDDLAAGLYALLVAAILLHFTGA